ncbi:MAG: hypothetical protein PHQ85_06625 [Eubacteriales bacterium]|jgi:RimK family alpha-L-glutamate ligase|nr:hypothetical protein [Eubacteriales bacterium]MDD4105131.1 hypothetical protein [Eubacteriales bacterium]MDD4710946.1 hypothetical protein [Eubacteriales bacterium]NLO15644.1 hypothetical protein [Clostridiales bacterium]
MNGWLIYDAPEVERNRVFIDKWFSAAVLRRVDLRLVLTRDIAYGIGGDRAFVENQCTNTFPDFAVMRAQHPVLSLHMENMGIPVFNNAEIAHICNDKRLTHERLCRLVPMMDTAFVEAGCFMQPFAFPVVVKSSHASGGRKVFLCRDKKDYASALALCAPDSAVVQPACDTLGKDVRAYVLGNRIVKTMMRLSNEGDFRSNLAQGGDAVPFVLPTHARQMVEAIAQQFHFGLVGVDFIFHKGELVFNEIEDAVGTRMLYMHTDMDIVRDYLDFILGALRGSA